MKKLFYFVISVLMLSGCGTPPKNKCNERCFGIWIDVSLGFKVVSEDGTDLLNPENENSYKHDEIEIWYLYPDGAYFKEDCPSCVISKGFQILYDKNRGYIMNLMMGSTKGIFNGKYINSQPETFTTYIHWNATDIDTVYTEFVHRCGTNDPYDAGYCKMYIYDKVYYNGELIVPGYRKLTSMPVIVK